jgi:isoquinoline 1-oxidoreductase beta subunit
MNNDNKASDPQTSAKQINRRDFLKAGSGLTIGIALGGLTTAQMAEASLSTPGLVSSWLNVSAANTVSLTIGTTEMGQGSRSGLAQIIAEDLCVKPNTVILKQGGATLAYTGSSAVSRGYATSTGGSGAIRNNLWALRDAATQAREMLVLAAMDANLTLYAVSDQLRANYVTANAIITHVPSGKTFTYGSVADAASTKTSSATAPDGPVNVIGTNLARADIPAKLNGTALYGIDVVLPNMVFAVVRHCPTLGGTLSTNPLTPSGALAAVPLKVFDFTFAEPTKNYASTTTLKLTRGLETTGTTNAVAVVATDTWNAMNKVNALSLAWTLPAAASALNDAQFLTDAQTLTSQTTMPSAAPGIVTSTSSTTPAQTLYTCEGSFPAISGSTAIDTNYSLPYVAHAAMEVLNCVVDYKPGISCTLYVSTQVQQNALKLVYLLLRQLGDTRINDLEPLQDLIYARDLLGAR